VQRQYRYPIVKSILDNCGQDENLALYWIASKIGDDPLLIMTLTSFYEGKGFSVLSYGTYRAAF
jgi:hypothetical protein